MKNSDTTMMGHIACFVAYVIFGLNIIVTKDIMAVGVISPLALFCLRSLGAGLLFWITSLTLPAEKILPADYMKIFAASFTGFFLTQITFLIGISDITPMDCSIMTSLSPIYTMFIAAMVLKEPITFKKAGGVLLSFLGVLFLIFNSVSSGGGAAETKPIGVLFMFLNGFCFSVYLGVFKPLIMRYSVVTFMKWIFLFSSLLSLPFAGGELAQVNYSALSLKFVAEIFYAIVFATFISYFLIPIGQKQLRPTLVSMYSYMQPIVATAISIYIGMDTLGWKKVLAAATVFAGVVLVNYSRAAKQR
ncbi:MAG: DMT family transporter [Bacteroidaceae bacterium]|nr:DMT family transporter [Bacteroidaceae bacterium]